MHSPPIVNNQGQNKNNYVHIFQMLPDAVLLAHAGDGVILDVNEAFTELAGYASGEIVGRTFRQLFFFLDPELWEEVFRTLAEHGKVRGIETRMLRKNGQIATVLACLRSLELDGKPCCLVTLHDHDIAGNKSAHTANQSQQGFAEYGLANLLSADVDINREEIGRLIDFEAIQDLMNSFYKLTRIPMAITDIKGNVQVATGWQDICTGFHRVHPETLALCKESDIYLSQNIGEGKYTLYKCKNNLWDLATPIVIGGSHIANLFLGQFFFDDEVPDYELFRKQAKRYGFDVEEYLAAVDKVPRWSRETIENAMELYSKLAVIISRLSLGNVRLARTLAEQERAEERVRSSLAEKEILLKEIHHRVKNNLQIISTLVELQSDYITDDNSVRFFRETQNRIRSMALVHEKLYQTKNFSRIDFQGYIESLVTYLFHSYVTDPEQVILSVAADNATLGIDDAIPCGLIINELVSNSLKHAFPRGRQGRITVSFHAEDQGWIVLTVTDTGIGLPSDLDFTDTETLGLQLVNLLVKQLLGIIAVRNDQGTEFTIKFKSKHSSDIKDFH